MSMADGLAWERAEREEKEWLEKVEAAAIVMDHLETAPESVRAAFIKLVGERMAQGAVRSMLLKRLTIS